MANPTGPLPFAVFGPGIIMLTRTDIANATPVNIGYAQELSLDLSGDTKELYGQKQFPLVSARSKIKATGKMKAAEVNGLAWSNFFYGQDLSAGAGKSWAIAEAQNVPATPGPYTVTVTHSATYNADLGVLYAASAVPLKRVASAPSEGQYSVDTATGIYTFAAADQAEAMLITYVWNNTTGQTLAIANQDIGFTPTFQLDYYTNLNQPASSPLAIRVYAGVAAKHSMAFKLDDFMMPEFDFGFFALANGKVIDYYLPL